MNNKGFTFIEMLATIVVLALIIAIAIPAYTGVSNAIRKNQRKNMISRIEVAASKYAFDTDKTIIFVDELITEGYIDSDDEEGNIKDPVNNERLNCYIVEMKKVSDYYNASFKDDNNYDVNGKCDLRKLQENSETLYIDISPSNENSEWLKGEITLSAYGIENMDCSKNKCLWTSSSGQNISGKSNHVINYNGVLDTTYNFQYTVFDNSDNVVKRYTKSVDLKIDNEAPIIDINKIEIPNRYENTPSKKVTIYASDGGGSGISGYYLGIFDGSLGCNSTSVENKYQKNNTFEVTKNGDYLICVKDNVGNITTSSLNINYIL